MLWPDPISLARSPGDGQTARRASWKTNVNDDVIPIEGRWADGGGQVVRTSLALAAALGPPVRIEGIRTAGGGGLRACDLSAVEAAARVCNADVTGAECGSTELTFAPGPLRPGTYAFDVGAGDSVTLILQTILPALLVAEGDSSIAVRGGATHTAGSPCFEYLRDVFGVLASAANLGGYYDLVRAGFAPAGGGEVRMEIQGLGEIEGISPLRFSDRGELKYIEGLSAASGALPNDILDRQTTQVLGRLAAAGHSASVEQAVWDTDSAGMAVFLRAVFARSAAGFWALGARGGSVDKIADDAVEALLAFLAAPGAVDPHAADQLLPIAAMCYEQSHYTTDRVTPQLLANAEVVRRIAQRQVRIEGRVGQPGRIVVEEY